MSKKRSTLIYTDTTGEASLDTTRAGSGVSITGLEAQGADRTSMCWRMIQNKPCVVCIRSDETRFFRDAEKLGVGKGATSSFLLTIRPFFQPCSRTNSTTRSLNTMGNTVAHIGRPLPLLLDAYRGVSLTSLRSARSHLVSTFKCGSSSCTIALRLKSAPLTNLAGSVMNVASSRKTAQTL